MVVLIHEFLSVAGESNRNLVKLPKVCKTFLTAYENRPLEGIRDRETERLGDEGRKFGGDTAMKRLRDGGTGGFI